MNNRKKAYEFCMWC